MVLIRWWSKPWVRRFAEPNLWLPFISLVTLVWLKKNVNTYISESTVAIIVTFKQRRNHSISFKLCKTVAQDKIRLLMEFSLSRSSKGRRSLKMWQADKVSNLRVMKKEIFCNSSVGLVISLKSLEADSGKWIPLGKISETNAGYAISGALLWFIGHHRCNNHCWEHTSLRTLIRSLIGWMDQTLKN